MKIRVSLLTICLLAISFLASAGNGNPGNGIENKKCDIGGGVSDADSGKPLANVSVTAYANSKKEKTVYTDTDGNYSFDDLKPGTYKLVFEKTGFKRISREKVKIRPDEGLQISVEMEEASDFVIMPGNFF